jgi:hypothetical protein
MDFIGYCMLLVFIGFSVYFSFVFAMLVVKFIEHFWKTKIENDIAQKWGKGVPEELLTRGWDHAQWRMVHDHLLGRPVSYLHFAVSRLADNPDNWPHLNKLVGQDEKLDLMIESERPAKEV